jgi:NADPH:quinone reductase
MAGQILNAMHVAASRNLATYSPYGSLEHEQLYFYGNLDFGPTVINRTFGIAWRIAGWAMPTFIEKICPVEANELKARVAAAITTTFASHFSKEISLAEAIAPENVAAYTKLATGEKFLVNPTR